MAVVGASPRSWIAETVRDNLRVMGSETRCHFVNPKYEELYGQPCYPSLEALPERPDVAVVAINPLRAASVTAAAAAAGIPAVIIPGGGVVEGGEAAAAMQLDVARIAREHGLALVGPNCMGVIDLTSNSATYIGDVSPYLPRGGVAGIAQSGSVTDAFVHSGNRVGFSRIISCGSEVVLDLCDYLAYCLDDPDTSSVILFVEGFKRPERFLALADRALELGKPIMAVKVGRSDQAQAAAVAHSGSLAGETRVTDAALDAAGVIRCRDLDELLETAELVEGVRRTGRRVGRGRTGVVTVSTGEASLIADLVPRTGVDLPPIPPSARAAILEALPTMGYIGNPLDPWGAADPATAYGAAFEAMAASDAYDVLVLVHDFPYRSLPSEVATANEVARRAPGGDRGAAGDPAGLRLADLRRAAARDEGAARRDRPRGAAPARGDGGVPGDRGGRATGRPATRPGATAGRGGRAGRRSPRTARRTAPTRPPRPPRPRCLDRPVRAGEPRLHGRRRDRRDRGGRRSRDAPTAVAAARQIGRPVALKLDAVGLVHKTDLGGIALGLRGDDAVYGAALGLLETGRRHGLAIRGLLVEPMAAPGLELILGLRRDPQFGPAVRRRPRWDPDRGPRRRRDPARAARRTRRPDAMLDDLRGARLLRGVRGRPPVDRAALVAMLVALGRLGLDRPDVLEVDLNPVIATAGGALAVDALVVLEGPPR